MRFRDGLGIGEKGGPKIVFCATLSSFSLDEFSQGLKILILITIIDGN